MKMKIPHKFLLKIPVENGKVAKLQKFKVDSARQGNPCLWISWRSEIVGEILRNHMSHIQTRAQKFSRSELFCWITFSLKGTQNYLTPESDPYDVFLLWDFLTVEVWKPLKCNKLSSNLPARFSCFYGNSINVQQKVNNSMGTGAL